MREAGLCDGEYESAWRKNKSGKKQDGNRTGEAGGVGCGGTVPHIEFGIGKRAAQPGCFMQYFQGSFCTE